MKKACKHFFRWLMAFLEKMNLDAIAAYSARATLFIIISFFPFMMMLLSLLRFLPFTQADLATLSFDFIPDTIKSLILTMVEELSNNTGALVLPLAAVTALWSASTGIISLVKGLNAVYGRTETRNYFVVRGIGILYTLAFIVILLVTLAVLVFGNSIYQWIKQFFPPLITAIATVISMRSVVALLVLTLFFTLLFKTVPNRKTRWFGELPGALLTAIAWVAFSYLYSLYIERLSNVSRIYGSLTAVVLLMIWLYACMYMLFIGAEINVLLQNSARGIYLLKAEEEEKPPKKKRS